MQLKRLHIRTLMLAVALVAFSIPLIMRWRILATECARRVDEARAKRQDALENAIQNTKRALWHEWFALRDEFERIPPDYPRTKEFGCGMEEHLEAVPSVEELDLEARDYAMSNLIGHQWDRERSKFVANRQRMRDACLDEVLKDLATAEHAALAQSSWSRHSLRVRKFFLGD